MPANRRRIPLLLAVLAAAGCQTMYYGAMEKIGIHKRDILVDRVKGARQSQQAAAKEFTDALQQFKSVVRVRGGDLEKNYNRLSAALQRSESRAQEVRDRIAAVESVAEALFREWKAELKQYSSAELRGSSETQLNDTRARYATLIAAMQRAEARLEPALRPLRDQVLFLKHNLNAKAIGGLVSEVSSIEAKVDALVQDLQASVNEAEPFLRSLVPAGS